jgi:DNA topoisomerase-1
MAKAGRQRKSARRVGPFTAPVDAAKAVALRHVSDETPGIRRRKSGSGFSYTLPDGATVRDAATLKRIKSLVIPPAWTDVWICTLEHGHLQATGRDARRRKQYRYHPRWNEVRAETKYGRTIQFGNALPAIRERLRRDLALAGIPKAKVLAVVVQLLEATAIRIGNEEYARTNKSIGLTTMKDRHVEIDGSRLRFRFRGKSGKAHEVALTDRRLARLVARCRDLPGQDLFQFVDDDGETRPISSSDVNEYIREISGEDFTAKDFRTWTGSLLAARQLAATSPFDDGSTPKSVLVAAIAAVANELGNTVAVCRKCYIHPLVLRAYEDRALYDRWIKEVGAVKSVAGLENDEAALLRFLTAESSAK